MENSKESAFPLSGHSRTNIQNEKGEIIASSSSGMEGLTKREYFAGLAMQGMISGHELQLSIEEASVIGGQAVQFADELLKRLEK